MKSNEKRKKRKKFRVNTPWILLYEFIRFTGAIPMAIFMRPKIIRLSKSKQKIKGAIIMANHATFLDPIMLQYTHIPRRVWSLATKELFSNPLKKFIFKGFLCIPVDRENMNIDTYKSVSSVLQAGKLLAMFPEGRINDEDDAEVKKFKGGVALFAIMNKAPIIPVYIVKKTKWHQRQKIIIGEPVFLENICNGTPSIKDMEYVSEYLHNKEEELANYYETNYAKKERKNGK